MIRRWVALGIAEAPKGFRRVKDYVHMPSLVAAPCALLACRRRGANATGCGEVRVFHDLP